MTSRNHSDERLDDILDELDENETHGLKFGTLPARYQDLGLSGADVSYMMNELEEHF